MAKTAKSTADSGPLFLPASQRLSHATYSDINATPYPASITPDNVRSAMNAAARGRPKAQNDFIDNMMESDPVLAGIYATRLFALNGKRWEIVVEDTARPGAQREETPERKQADEIAAYCSETLHAAEGFEESLKHGSDAIGRSYSVNESIWDTDGRSHFPVGFVPVPHNAIEGDTSEYWRLHVHTHRNSSPGEPLASYPFKFIVHAPNIIAHNPFRGGALRRCMPVYLYRRLGLKWWTSYVEMYGTPYRTATYGKNATPQEKRDLQTAMEEWGHLGWGIFPDSMKFDLLDQFRGGDSYPHPKLIDAIDNWYAITLLGQNLTTQVSEGSFAAAKVHNEVRGDILASDIANESATIRNQLLKPMVLLKFGPGAPVPYFRRIVETPKDTKATAELLGVAVNTLGMTVTKGFAATELGIPLSKDENADDPLTGGASAPSPFGPGGFFTAAGRNRWAENDPQPMPALPPNLAKRTSPKQILGGWQAEMVAQSAKQANAVVKALAKGIGTIEQPRDGAEQLTAAIEDLPIESFTDAVHDFILACLLAGAYNADKQLQKARGRYRFADEPSFWMQPFRQAIGALRDRLLLKPDDFLSLDRAARSRAGRIAGEYNLAIVKDAYASIETQLEEGGTVRDFKLAIQSLPKKDGWDGENTWHANVVFQQNSMMAYHSAHLQRYAAAGVQYWQYAGYDESCPICGEILEKTAGKSFPMSDTTYYPPTHFGCDCYAEPVLDEPGDIIAGESIDTPNYDASQESPHAFRYDPRQFAKTEPFSLASVPELLRETFRDFAIAHGWEIVE